MSDPAPRPARRVASNNPSAGPAKRLSPHDRTLALRKEQQMHMGAESGSNSTEYEYIVVEEEVEEDDDDDVQPVVVKSAARPPVAGRAAVVTRLASSSSGDSSDTSYLYEEDEETEFTPSEQPAFLQMIGASPLSQSFEPTKPPRKVQSVLSPAGRQKNGNDATWSNTEAQPNVSMESFQRSGSNLTGWTGAHFLTPRNSGERNDLDQFDRLQRGSGARQNKNGGSSPTAQDVVRGQTPQRKSVAGLKRPPSGHTKPGDGVALTDALLNPLRRKTERRRVNAKGSPAKARPAPVANISTEAQPSAATGQTTTMTMTAGPSPAPAPTTTTAATAAATADKPPLRKPSTGAPAATTGVPSPAIPAAPTAAGAGASAGANAAKNATPATPAAAAASTGTGNKPPNRALLRTSPGLSPEAQAKAAASAAAAPAGHKEATARAKPSAGPTTSGTAAATTTVFTSSAPVTRQTTTTATAPTPTTSEATAPGPRKLSVVPSPSTRPLAVSQGTAHPPPTAAPGPSKVPLKSNKTAIPVRSGGAPVTPKPATIITAGLLSPKADEALMAAKRLAPSPVPQSASDPITRARRNSTLPFATVHSPSLVSLAASRPLAGASNATLPPGMAGDPANSDPSSSASVNSPTKLWRGSAGGATRGPAAVGLGGSESPNSGNETLAGHSSAGTHGDTGLAPRRKRALSNRPSQVRMTAVDMITNTPEDVPAGKGSGGPTAAAESDMTHTSAPPKVPSSPAEKRLGTAVLSTNAKVPNKPLSQNPSRADHATTTTTAAPTPTMTATTPTAATKGTATKPGAEDATAAGKKQKIDEAVQKKRDELLAKMKHHEPTTATATAAAATATATNDKTSKPTASTPTAPPPPHAARKPDTTTTGPASAQATTAASAIVPKKPVHTTAPQPPPRQTSSTDAHMPPIATSSAITSPAMRTLTRITASSSQNGSPAIPPLRQTSGAAATSSHTYSRGESTDSAVTGSTNKTPRTSDVGGHNGPGTGPLPLPLPPPGQRGFPTAAAATAAPPAPVRTCPPPLSAVAKTAAPAPCPAATADEAELSPAKRARRRSNGSGGRNGSAGGRASLMTSQVLFDPAAGADHHGGGKNEDNNPGVVTDSSYDEQQDSGHRDGSGRPHRYKRTKRKQQQLRMTEIPAVTAAPLMSPLTPATTTNTNNTNNNTNTNSQTKRASVPDRGVVATVPRTGLGAAAPDHDYQRVANGAAHTTPAALHGATLYAAGSGQAGGGDGANAAHARTRLSDPGHMTNAAATDAATGSRQPFLTRFSPAERTQAAPYRQAVLYFNKGIEAQIKAMEERQQSEEREQEQRAVAPGRRDTHTALATTAAGTGEAATTRPRPQSTLPHTKPAARYVAAQSSVRETQVSPSSPKLTGLANLDRGTGGVVGERPDYVGDASPRPGVRHTARGRPSPSSAGPNTLPRATSYNDEGRFGMTSSHTANNGGGAGGGAGRASQPSAHMSDMDKYAAVVPPVRGSDGLRPRLSRADTSAMAANDESLNLPPVHRRSTTRPLATPHGNDAISHRNSTTGQSGGGIGGSSSSGADVQRHRRRVNVLNDGSEIMLMEDVSDVENSADNTPPGPSPRQRTQSNGRRRSNRIR